MAILSALLSFISRQLSSLVRAVFGWSVTGLFGRMPGSRQTALSVALIISIVWPLLIVGIFIPAVAGWALAFLPLERWLGARVMRIVWLVLAVALPIAVGAITRWVTHEKRTKGTVRTLIGGYPLALGFAVAFWVTLVVVPLVRLDAIRRGFKDEHVYLQVDEGSYERVFAAIARACRGEGIEAIDEPLPAWRSLPTWVLRWFARSALDPIVASDPRRLRNPDFEAYLYPGDLLLRGRRGTVERARTAIATHVLDEPAHLAESPRAQAIEDELHGLWGVLRRHRDPDEIGAIGRHRLAAIAGELRAAEVPFDDWSLLALNLHALERAFDGAPPAAAMTTTQTQERHIQEESPMERDPRPAVPTAELIREALDETRQLVRVELALAKDELRTEVREAKESLIAFAVGGVLAIAALAVLLVALATAISSSAWSPFAVGMIALGLAVGAGVLGWQLLPTKPLEKTRKRLQLDARMLQERMA